MTYRMIDTSKAFDGVGDADLTAILGVSRLRNPGRGITGLLLFHDGIFLQVLEGDRPDVEALYARIERDPRHYAVDRLFIEHADARLFGDWSMAYTPLSPEMCGRIAGSGRFVSLRAVTEVMKRSSDLAARFLLTVTRSMLRDAAAVSDAA